MTNLADKRIGIIGTGATAVQCVPHLAKAAGQVYVFQRLHLQWMSETTHPQIRNGSKTSPLQAGSNGG